VRTGRRRVEEKERVKRGKIQSKKLTVRLLLEAIHNKAELRYCVG